MSIVLLSTTESLQVVLDAAPATNQLPCVPSWADIGGSAGGVPVLTNGTTAVTVVPAPASSVARVINSLSIPNRDTATRIVTVNKVVSAVSYQIIKVSLPTGFQLYYQNNGGWRVLDASGNFIESVQANQVGTWTVNANQSGIWNAGGVASGFVAQSVTGTTPLNIVLAVKTAIRGLYISSVSASLAAGSVNLMIKDGGGTTVISINLPTAPATALAPFKICDVDNLNIPLSNGASNGTVNLASNLTGGSFFVGVSAS